jgi:hypothetical protein
MKSTSKSSVTPKKLSEDQIEAIAIVCHDANRALCITQGDESQVVWTKASHWQRKSAIAGVQFVLDNPTATSEETHESWMSHKIKDGWTLGPIKDGAKKTHPCLVPYGQLPESQRKKDHLFRAIVLALAFN